MEFEAFADGALLFVANLVCYFVLHCNNGIKNNNNNIF